jgi:hypothetical protein
MISPRPVVADVHPLLATPGGADEGAVHVEDGPPEEVDGLLGPGLDPGVVEDVLKGVDVGLGEASAEVAGGGGVGNAGGAESVEVDLVVAAKFEVLEAGAFAEGVEGEVEDVVGLVVREMDLEEVKARVDGVDKSKAAGEEVEGADAAVGESASAAGDIVEDVGGGEDGLVEVLESSFVEAVEDSLLASLEFPAYLGVHSKLLLESD